MALTEFQTKKMKRLFKLYDVDNDGTIGANDYERRIATVAEHRGYTEGSDDYEQLKSAVMGEWEKLQLYSDTDGDGKVTEFEFMEFADYTLADDNLWFETAVETAEFLIETCDIDGDGMVSLEEYKVFFKGYNVSDEDIEFAFGKLDADGDGQITTDEFTKAFDRYGNSNNPDEPANFMFGPLE